MSRMFKRIASAALVLMMLLSLAPNIPLKAQAASAVPSFYVTDASGTIIQKMDQDGNGLITLLLDSSGNPTSTDANWVSDAYYEVSGTGVFELQLGNASQFNGTVPVRTLIWNLNRIRVTNGATLVVRFGIYFMGDESVTINAMTASPVFDVKEGSLLLHWSDDYVLPSELVNDRIIPSRYENIRLTLDGKNRPTATQPLININSTSAEDQYVLIQNTTFRNSSSRAIRAYSDELAYLYLRGCTFESTVYSVNGGGGAIRLYARTDRSGVDSTTGKRCDIETFVMQNCKFLGNHAISDGGAIDSNAKIKTFYLENCIFSGTYAIPETTVNGELARGGAIALKGYVDMFHAAECTFDECEAQSSGGALYFGSHQDGEGRYSRMVEIRIDGAAFTECSSTSGSGGAVAIQTQLTVLNFYYNELVRCTSVGNGGGVALLSKKFLYYPVSFQGDGNDYVYDWDGVPYSTIMQISVGENVGASSFVDCVSGQNGGAISVGANLYVERAVINATVDRCAATNMGSALYLGQSAIAYLGLSGTVRNCYFVDDGADNGLPYPGTISVVSNASCMMDMNNCTMENNEGGSLYWNANEDRPSLFGEVIVPNASVRCCTITAPDVGIISSPLDMDAVCGGMSVSESSITAPLDIVTVDSRMVLLPTTAFPEGITVEGTTLNALLEYDAAYYQNGKQVTPTDEETALDGDVEIHQRCDHAGALIYDPCNDELHSWLCQSCGASGKEDHNWDRVLEEPTCAEDGAIISHCTICGHILSETIPATGHGYEAVVTAPTCTQGGYTTYTCPCGVSYTADEVAALGHSYADGVCATCGEADPDYVKPVVIPTLTLKAPALEFKDMITVNAFYTAENTEDVVEMGMITYEDKVDVVDISTADHVIPGATYEEYSGRYFASSQGIHAKFIGDTVYLACYAKLTDGSYVYTKLAGYSPITYATNQLQNSGNTQVKQLVASMLNYGAAAQAYFGHNTDRPADSALTAEQKLLPDAYTEDMVSTVAAVSTDKQGIFANNKGFSQRKPAVSFEGAFSINYFFTPAYVPVDGITLYYWNEADFNAADVLTVDNATGSMAMSDEGNNLYRGDITGIAAKDLSKAVYVAAVYSDGTTTWTSGVLGYSIGAYCKSLAAKGGAMADLAKATAVYGYHAKQYFG